MGEWGDTRYFFLLPLKNAGGRKGMGHCKDPLMENISFISGHVGKVVVEMGGEARN